MYQRVERQAVNEEVAQRQAKPLQPLLAVYRHPRGLLQGLAVRFQKACESRSIAVSGQHETQQLCEVVLGRIDSRQFPVKNAER